MGIGYDAFVQVLVQRHIRSLAIIAEVEFVLLCWNIESAAEKKELRWSGDT